MSNLKSENLRLKPNPNPSTDSAEEMYACYGAHVSTEDAGDVCIQSVDWDWMDDDMDASVWRDESLSALGAPSEGDFSACDGRPPSLSDAVARGDDRDLLAWVDYLRSYDGSQEGLQAAADDLADDVEATLEQVREINRLAEKTDDYAVLRLRSELSRLSWEECESVVDLARRVRSDMEPIAEALERAACAAVDGDLDACIEAIEEARNLETEHGDDPSTSSAASQLLEIVDDEKNEN